MDVGNILIFKRPVNELRPRQLELDDGRSETGMTLEDAGDDQIAHRSS